MIDQKPVVILGGGSAGLATAVRLLDGGLKNVVVVEAKPQVGGLALSFTCGDCRLDYGPHAFHSKGDAADEMFKRFCARGYRDVYMKAKLLLHGKYFDYPLKFGRALLALNPLFTTKMLTDYFSAQFKQLFVEVPEDCFEAWGVKRYGRTMYEMAFGNYSRKVWGTPTTELHWKMAQQKLPDLNFFELIRETLGGKGARQKILYSSYYYPNGGIGTIFEGMEEFILGKGGRIVKGARPTEVRLDLRGAVESVTIEGTNGRERVPCSCLVTTIPISELVNTIRPAPGQSVLDFCNNLRYRNLILVMVEVDTSNVTGQIMVYLLDKHFTFNRVGEQKNIDASMIPHHKTVLCLEMCVDDRSPFWTNGSDDTLFQLAKKDLLRLGTIQEEKITDCVVRRLEHAYPVYDLAFDRNLSGALEYLLDIRNVIPLGRQGLFIHNDIHDSMKMGIEGAEFILSGCPHKSVWTEKVRSFLDWRLE